jgi:hypothetical protein
VVEFFAAKYGLNIGARQIFIAPHPKDKQATRSDQIYIGDGCISVALRFYSATLAAGWKDGFAEMAEMHVT